MELSPSRKPCATEFDIRHCDCIAGMELLQEGCVDLVAHPPYNLAIRYSSYQDNDKRDSSIRRALDKSGAFLSQCSRSCRHSHASP